MNALVAVVLICAASVPTDRCTRETALDVRVVPGLSSPLACAMAGQTTLAREPNEMAGLYPLTRCERRHD